MSLSQKFMKKHDFKFRSKTRVQLAPKNQLVSRALGTVLSQLAISVPSGSDNSWSENGSPPIENVGNYLLIFTKISVFEEFEIRQVGWVEFESETETHKRVFLVLRLVVTKFGVRDVGLSLSLAGSVH